MNIEGLIVAMVTPFDHQQQIDAEATKRLIDHLLARGVSGLFILGTNGEFHMLSRQEKRDFAKLVIDHTQQRVPVYVGTGGNTTQEVIDLSQEMAALGADALSVISPYFVSLTQDELYAHYRAIAAAVSIPVILYNIPKLTGNALSPDLVARLAQEENIRGIKDSSGDIDNIRAYIERTKEQDFAVLSGSDSLILKALQLGATGAVAATANVLTDIDVGIVTSFKAGDLAQATRYQESIEAYRRILKYGTIPSVLKYTLGHIGLPVGEARRPVQPVQEQHREAIATVMAEYFS